MNVLVLVIDSLRARSLPCTGGEGARTPFLDDLARATVFFRRAYATECWTLPTHASMFTGLLPSEHRAHFQGMGYRGTAPTVASLLAAAGYHTEIVTRNPQFDGTVPGLTRGFRASTRLLAEFGWRDGPLALLVALQKPRLRRIIAAGGWFSLLQKRNRAFVSTMARLGVPADRLVLDYLLEQMARRRRADAPFFYVANLYDVHAPYSPSPRSFFTSFHDGWTENLSLPAMCRIIAHEYLRPGFHMPEYARRAMLRRYHRAIGLMDAKLAAFFAAARRAGVLDDALVIVTADHGEAFGEHGLYYHDASVYNTHLHVPLWIHHPACAPAVVDEVVSTRSLFHLLAQVGLAGTTRGTILDAAARAARPVALAEHFHYPHVPDILPRYAQNIAAAIVGSRKLIVRREGVLQYDLASDPDERAPATASLASFVSDCRRDGAPAAAIRAATEHLGRWAERAAAA